MAESDEKISINSLSTEILQSIFQYLNYRDLLSAAKVCRTWSKNAIYEKGFRRGPYSSFGWYVQSDFVSIRESTIKPSLGFFFLLDVDNFSSAFFHAIEAICKSLPRKCKIIMLLTYVCNSVVRRITVGSNENLISSEMIRCAVLFLLLPQISNVQISMIVVQNREISKYTEMIETAFRQNHKSFMCILLFCNYNCSSVGSEMAKIAYSRFHNNKKVSFFGGGGFTLMTNNKTGACNQSDCIALLITGSMQTWSIVLTEETMDLAKEKLQIFKEQVQLQKYTMGFVFFSEELTYFKEEYQFNELLAMFKKLFPKVSLIGCCNHLIFGRDTATYEKKFLGPHSEQWHILSPSISFVILTYG